jgi:hypothetical protein
MPRGDKSKYTDKQERKADHIVESYEQRGYRKKRPSVARGRLSTRMTEAARNRGRVAEGRRAIRPLTKAAVSAAPLQPLAPQANDRPPRRRRRRRANGARIVRTRVDEWILRAARANRVGENALGAKPIHRG